MHYEKIKFSSDKLALYYPSITLRNDRHSQYTHFHSPTELICVREGTLRIHIDKKPHVLGVGEMAAIPSNVSHLLEAISAKCKYTVLIFDGEALFPPLLKNQSHSTITKDEEVIRLFEQLLQLRQDRNPLQVVKFNSVLTLLMIRLIELQTNPLAPRIVSPTPEVTEVMYYLSRHYREDIHIKDIAQTVGYHPDHLSRIFKRTVGQTIVEFQTALRCDLARRQLMDGRSVSYAARRSGFTSLNYFSRVYKKFYGYPPSAEHPDFL